MAPKHDVDKYVAVVAQRLHQRVDTIGDTLRAAIEEAITELPADADVAESMAASIAGNLETIAAVLLAGTPATAADLPLVTLEFGRLLAQHDVPVTALVRAYRLGQRQLTEVIFGELHNISMEPETRVAVIERLTTVLLEYVDWAAEQFVAAYAEEHQHRLVQQSNVRTAWVRGILDDHPPVDTDVAAEAIRYPLRWHHLALIIWRAETDARSDEFARLRRFTADLAAAVGASDTPLCVAADRTSAWVWLPYRDAPGDVVTKVRDYAGARPDAPGVAMGAVGSGMEGFRRSHRQAQRVRAAARARNLAPPAVVAATDSGLLASALLGSNVQEIREWVADVLGPLASETDDDARLRRVLHIFLRADSGYPAAARDLGLSFTAFNRLVEQAVSRRGRPLDDRLDVELALLACQWYGAAVLRRN
ncbi:PucR family transcriptional regulator [Mycobacterium bourgelatii]|uniref:PucR family transcriptional regulator n=1 Tax=Mycobacterium bourgelatii TaxID=1273442 RepID=UPI0013D4398A|nr:PucR family transcriptional regulator [Mycobacterium bourgelatii]MCV6976075.1 PucR family transcriptional regulator [Mycobacterium bourgelatii]